MVTVAIPGTQSSFRHVGSVAVGFDVDELGHKVGVLRATGGEQPDEDLAGYLDWRFECIGGVDQHVVAVLDLALVLHPVGYEDGGEEEDEAALRGHRVVRVVAEPVLRAGACNSGSESAVTGAAVGVTTAVEIVRHLGPRRWPVLRLEPPILAGLEIAYCRAAVLLRPAFEPSIKPGDDERYMEGRASRGNPTVIARAAVTIVSARV